MNRTLWQRLEVVGARYRALWRSLTLAAAWSVLAGIGTVALASAGRDGRTVSGALATAVLAAMAVAATGTLLLFRRTHDARWVARRLERRFPDLNARLITAVEQRPDPHTGRHGYFQQRIVAEAIDHDHAHAWPAAVPGAVLMLARASQWLTLALLAVVLVSMLRGVPRATDAPAGVGTALKVEPGDTSLERGTALLVLAHVAGPLPGDVSLVTDSAAAAQQTLAMSKSLDDPLFAARVPNVDADVRYAVRYGREQTPWFTARVFDYPELKQADADLAFPAYTNLPAKHVDDIRSLTAVEGTTATLTLRLNKPVAAAELRPDAGATLTLTPDPHRPDVVTATLPFKASQTFRLYLRDDEGRENKQPAATLAVHVNPNRVPELKPVSPGHDVDVSPLQELTVGVHVSDDFGVRRAGVSYGLAGGPTRDVVLAADVRGGQKQNLSHTISLEQLGAEADQLLSYFFWAEDTGPDGQIRRSAGDMYFAEVRPFDEIFRQGDQPSPGQQRQQQNGNGQQAEQLAELQKQVIAATWTIVRRETSAVPTASFKPDATLVSQSQATAHAQAAALDEKLTDSRSRGYLKAGLAAMDQAGRSLDQAAADNAVTPLAPALAAEQAAYQALLKLRAREFDVVRGNQPSQGASASSASSRRQQQLDQLKLDADDNRYQTQRSAAPQADNPQQRETRQVLSRLKELARRQEDLNRQMQELRSALDQARDAKQRDELARQLARLRDQQDQQLRDTDELRDRMDRPENQDNLADARQSLEQGRENVRQASQQLQQGRVPEAAASGARAAERLNDLRDQVRKRSAGQLTETMTDLRQQARALDEDQQRLAEQLNKLDANPPPSLRDAGGRKQIADKLGGQKNKLDRLTDALRKTVEATEADEPLVSKQLYDTLRQAGQQQTDRALDTGRQLLDQGVIDEARQAEAEAAKGVSQLRQGVEQAATGVLGDEAESLRRARAELDRLAEDVRREADRNRPAGPSTRPSDRGATAQAATRSARRDGEAGPAIVAGPTTQTGGPPASADDRQNDARPPGGLRGPRPDSTDNGRRPGPDNAARPGGPPDSPNEQTRGPGEPGRSSSRDGRPAERDPQQQAGDGQQPGQGQPPAPQPPSAGAPQPNGRQPDANPPGDGGRGQDGERDSPDARGARRQATARGGAVAGGDPNAPNDGRTGVPGDPSAGPLTGETFRDWSDRLRDVEEMVDDPKLRDRAARIRETARDVRIEFKRHGTPPNWDAVRETIGTPLTELRDRVSEELLRRQSPNALVPLDRDAVPPQYAEQVKRYYERLGAGR